MIDFDSRVVVLQTFTNNVDRARAGDPQDVGRRLDVAVQRDLHRAEGSEEGRRHERRGDPAPGDRRPLGRRGHVEPAAVRGSARPREALRDGDLRDRPARPTSAGTATKGFKEAEFVLRQFVAGNRRPRVLPEPGRRPGRRLRPDLRRALEPVHGRLHVEEPEARRRLAPGRRPRRPAEHRSRGPSRATSRRRRTDHELRPAGALRRRARRLRLALRAARRRRSAARRRRCSSPAALVAHLRHRHADDGGRARAGRERHVGDLDVRLAAGARVSLHRDDDRRAGDGRLHPAAARRAPGDSRVQARHRGSRGRCCRGRCSASTCRRCSSPTPASRSPA